MTTTISPVKFLKSKDIDVLVLAKGSHDHRERGLCLMEAVAFFNGERHSDRPECACPVLTSFGIGLNDAWSDDDRQRLKPFIPKLVGTRSTPEVERKRSMMALDWLVRFYTSAWLEMVPALKDDAERLRALAPLVDQDTAKAAGKVVKPARDHAAAAWDAAWDAAGAAAWDAARAAARDAAWDAAGAAAGAAARDAAGAAAGAAAWAAAWDAARAAAGAAARAAAWDAARDAARAILAPTVKRLQDSALELFQRMIDVKPDEPATSKDAA